MARKGLGSLLDDVEEDIAQPVPATPEPATAASSGNLPVPSADLSKALQEIERINSGLNSLVGSMEASRMLFRQAAEKIDNINLNFEEAEKVLQNYKTAMAELSERFEKKTQDAKEFTFNAALDTKTIERLDFAYGKLVNNSKKMWEAFTDEQNKWAEAHEAKVKAMLKDGNKGVRLSEGLAVIFVIIVIILLGFYMQTIYINHTFIHSAQLSSQEWLFFFLIVLAIVGLIVYWRRCDN
jgi:dGTP triphosphohydrolase